MKFFLTRQQLMKLRELEDRFRVSEERRIASEDIKLVPSDKGTPVRFYPRGNFMIVILPDGSSHT